MSNVQPATENEKTTYVITYTDEETKEKAERRFNSVKEVLTFLNISRTTYYKLVNGEYKFVQQKTKKFKNLGFVKINSNSKYHKRDKTEIVPVNDLKELFFATTV